MTPEEKWERIQNPKTADDWGLTITEEELNSFPAGRKIVEDLHATSRMITTAETLRRNPENG